MFNIYGFDIIWGRSDLAEVFEVSANRAAQILLILQEVGLIERVKRGSYKF